MKQSKVLAVMMGALLATQLVACNTPAAPATTASSPATSAAPTTSTAPVAKEVEKPKSITFMANGNFIIPEAGQAEILAKFKEMTGIELIVNQPAHNQYVEKVNLMFATSDVPDALILDADMRDQYSAAVKLYDIKKEYDASETLQQIDKTLIDSMIVDGKLYGLPRGEGNGTITYVRKDWLEKLNLKAPTNYDEFLNMLRQFKTLGSDIIPYTAPGIVSDQYPTYSYTVEFFQDAIPDFQMKDGKWVDGMMQPEMVPALERFRAAFAEGLIDREIVTNKTSTARDKMTAGKAGTFNYWAGVWNETLDKGLKATDPNGEVIAIPAMQNVTFVDRVPGGVSVTSGGKNPEATTKYFLEFMFDRGEGQMLFTQGIEGVQYKMENGKVVKLPSKANPTQAAGQIYFPSELNANKFDDHFTLGPQIVNSRALFKAKSVIAPKLPISSVLIKNSADILIARKEALADIIYGNIGVKEGLERYQKTIGATMEKVLADMNK